MKRLFLLRHAKSSWDDAGLADHDRTLAPRGRRASALIAEHARRNRQASPGPVLLGPADARDPPTAALATLTFAGKWSELGNEGGQLVDYVKPKQLKGSV